MHVALNSFFAIKAWNNIFTKLEFYYLFVWTKLLAITIFKNFKIFKKMQLNNTFLNIKLKMNYI